MIQLQTGEPQTAELGKMVETSAQRGAGLVRQVLAFARGTQGERTEIDPRHVIKEVIALLSQTLPRNIEMKMELAQDLPQVLADSTQLSQIVMNLGVNARDAMPEGGRLLVSAHQVELADDPTRNPPVKAGTYVRISAKDTGTGIPPEIIGKIFDPFFTTKNPGHGTGLGLATVLSIVKSHGGFLEVDSQMGQGTEFRLFFPAVEAKAPAPEARPNPVAPKGRGETILVVDDEPSIREMLTVMLESFGYRVHTRSDGHSALALYREKQGEIAAVITDLVMPGMQGDELVRQLWKISPSLPIVAMSGILSAWKNIRQELGRLIFVQKPMSAYGLLKAVRDVLPEKAA
jgi:CheY-like chemotaxis protein